MSYIIIKCEECEKNHKLDDSMFEYEQVDFEPKDIGPEITYEGVIEKTCSCDQSINVSYLKWEDADGIESHRDELKVSGAIIVKHWEDSDAYAIVRQE